MFMKKDYVQNIATCSCENKKYVVSTVNNSAIMCNEIIESMNNNE